MSDVLAVPEYIVGEQQEFEAFQSRLREAFARDNDYVVGGVGRAAIERDLKGRDAAWLHLRADGGWRDIDVLNPFIPFYANPNHQVPGQQFVLDYGVHLRWVRCFCWKS